VRRAGNVPCVRPAHSRDRPREIAKPEPETQHNRNYTRSIGLESAPRGHNPTHRAFSESQARFRPSPDEWSVADVLRHVDAAMRSTSRIIKALATGKEAHPDMDAPPVLEDAGKTLAELRNGVAESYDEVRAAVAAIPDGPAAEATPRHPFFGDLNCKEWAAFVYVHSRDHANQIEQVKARPSFPR